MGANFKPLLAFTIKDMSKIEFPVLASPKIDGIRCCVKEGSPLSRSLKPIPNVSIFEKLSTLHGDFIFDGELISGNDFNSTTSHIMTHKGNPEFKYLLFDCIQSGSNLPFSERLKILNSLTLPSFCQILEQTLINNEIELKQLYDRYLEEGFEGVIVRKIDGNYKFGRSTEKEGLCGKLKPFNDKEFKVIGYEPLFINNNESVLDNLGNKKKASIKENLEATESLGSLTCTSENGTFNVGSGLTQQQREEFWEIKDQLVGKWVKVKYLDYGGKDLPRHPVFLGFRSEDDK